MPTAEQVEWFFRTALSQGIGWVVITALAGCFLWFCVEVTRYGIRLVKAAADWLPKFFAAQVELLGTLQSAIASLAESHTQDSANTAALLAELKIRGDSWQRRLDELKTLVSNPEHVERVRRAEQRRNE